MPNLCAHCESQVSYFGRRFAHHRWFCDSDCLRRWETETQQADSAAHSGATERHRLSRRQIIIRGAVAAAAFLFTAAALLVSVLFPGVVESNNPAWVGLAWMAVIAVLWFVAGGFWYVYLRF